MRYQKDYQPIGRSREVTRDMALSAQMRPRGNIATL